MEAIIVFLEQNKRAFTLVLAFFERGDVDVGGWIALHGHLKMTQSLLQQIRHSLTVNQPQREIR
ncbi:hypothetical protein [Paenibacillus sp. PL91]|uniref:hypothetical protein n=1 Tax=Paenibacillus sp. PL91 TaxID=2729538 RepID=UPI00145ECE28|nr:hypothetical protein [Paenibacillus sp. PL91]MBC9202440.1 hypothetical protein [Paenibacillus sp. PL91]